MKKIFFLSFLFIFCSANAQQTSYVDFESASALLGFQMDSLKVGGNMAFRFEILQSVDSIFIDAVKMKITDIRLRNATNGQELEVVFTNTEKKLWIKHKFRENVKYKLYFQYWAKPKKALYFVGWDNQAPNQIWTQGQGKYTSNWLPSFDDTNEKLKFNISVTFDNQYKVISNGLQTLNIPLPGATKWHFQMQKPMPSYLVALAIGKYDKKVEYSNSGVPLEMYYYPKDSMKVEPTYRFTKIIFDYFEEEIGVAFPWQNYKQVPVHDFLYAGMENTSLTIFSDDFMIDDTAFIDKNYVNVNAHELAHQWFGDFVTAISGEHHWLQEGFATYYALLAERMLFGEDYYYWKLYESAQQLQDQNKSGESTSLLNPKSSSLTFYQRGAWVLHALKEKVGADAFKEATRNYLNMHAYANVATDDFLDEVERVSEVSLSEFRILWLENSLFPFDEAMKLLKQSVFIQEYEMVDCELLNAKCDYYLTSGISDQAKAKIIAQIPNRLNPEVFSSSIMARQSIAQNLTTIPLNLKVDYESLLDDPSYKTIEMALYNLWVNFPESRADYLNKTEGIKGFSDYNIRQLWLVLALSTPYYNDDKKPAYFDELELYSSPDYAFSIRQNAFSYINSLQVFSERSLRNLIDATKHHNWRFKSFSKNLLESLAKDEKYNTIINTLETQEN